MAAKEERGGNGKKAEAGEMEEDGGQFFGRLDIIRPRVVCFLYLTSSSQSYALLPLHTHSSLPFLSAANLTPTFVPEIDLETDPPHFKSQFYLKQKKNFSSLNLKIASSIPQTQTLYTLMYT